MTSSANGGDAYNPAAENGLRFHTAIPAFRNGGDSPRQYLERCLATIAERDSLVRAWVTVNEDGARAQADASTARWRRDEPLSPIDGMPIGIKDLLETRDMPTQMSCAAFAGNFPRRDNAAVWALRQAGAVIVGKTVTTELGGPQPSPTTNPWDSRRTPGGSSSGSGAAVAAAMVPATIATQTGGSLMRPASFCGVWGFKPSQGAINRGERQTASTTTHGVHAACPQDMWQIAIEIASRAGGDPGRPALFGPPAPPPALRPGTIAVLETEAWERLDPVSREVYERVLDRVEDAGVAVLRRAGDPVVERVEQAVLGATELGSAILAWEHSWAFRDLAAERPADFSDRVKRFFFDAADRLGAAGYEEALRSRAQLSATFALLAPRVDAVVLPTSSGPAPIRSVDVPGEAPPRWPTGDPGFNFPSSLLGVPAVNVPLMAVGGMPFGLQVMGQPGTDAATTAIARWMGEALPPVSA